jgi:uncharacterized protein
MTERKFGTALVLLAPALVLWGCDSRGTPGVQAAPPLETREKAVVVQYLEVVTPDVDATCAALEKVHGVRFGKAEAELGGARTAALAGGGRLGVRAPLRADEAPVVRPYVLVDDVEAAVKTAEAAGGQFAMYATETPGLGTFAIYSQGGIDYGLWKPRKKQP